MKTNLRNEDAIARAMGWLDQLRADRHEATSHAGQGAGSGVIQAVEPPLLPWPAQVRHRETLRDYGRAS